MLKLQYGAIAGCLTEAKASRCEKCRMASGVKQGSRQLATPFIGVPSLMTRLVPPLLRRTLTISNFTGLI